MDQLDLYITPTTSHEDSLSLQQDESTSNDQLETIMEEESKDYISLSSTQDDGDVNFQSFQTSNSFSGESDFQTKDRGKRHVDANFESFQTVSGSSINDLEKLEMSQLSSLATSLREAYDEHSQISFDSDLPPIRQSAQQQTIFQKKAKLNRDQRRKELKFYDEMFNTQRQKDKQRIESQLQKKVKVKSIKPNNYHKSVKRVFNKQKKDLNIYNAIKHECMHCQKKPPEAEVLIDQIQKYKKSNNILEQTVRILRVQVNKALSQSQKFTKQSPIKNRSQYLKKEDLLAENRKLKKMINENSLDFKRKITKMQKLNNLILKKSNGQQNNVKDVQIKDYDRLKRLKEKSKLQIKVAKLEKVNQRLKTKLVTHESTISQLQKEIRNLKETTQLDFDHLEQK